MHCEKLLSSLHDGTERSTPSKIRFILKTFMRAYFKKV